MFNKRLIKIENEVQVTKSKKYSMPIFMCHISFYSIHDMSWIMHNKKSKFMYGFFYLICAITF